MIIISFLWALFDECVLLYFQDMESLEGGVCHNCLSWVPEADLLLHFAAQQCKSKCDKCFQEVRGLNCWVPDPAYSDEMRLHQVTPDCTEQSIKCFFCNKCCVKFPNDEEFATHEAQRCPITCGHCGVRFCRRLTRKQHARTCLGVISKCYHCQKTFKGSQRKQEYVDHLNTCETILQCNICQVNFSGVNAVKKYTKHYQKGDHKKACEHCGVEIVAQTLDHAYKRHLHIHHHDLIEKEEIPAECEECGVDFGIIEATKQNKWELLQEHIQVGCFNHMYKGKNAECIVCHKTFTVEGGEINHRNRQRALKRHYNNGCEPLQCPRCKNEFVGRNKRRYLTNHAKKCRVEPAVAEIHVEVPDTLATNEGIIEEEEEEIAAEGGDVDFQFADTFEGAVEEDSEDDALLRSNADILERNFFVEEVFIDNVATLKLRPKFCGDVAINYEDVVQDGDEVGEQIDDAIAIDNNLAEFNDDGANEEEEEEGGGNGEDLYHELQDIDRQTYGRKPLPFQTLNWVDVTKLPWTVNIENTFDWQYDSIEEVIYCVTIKSMPEHKRNEKLIFFIIFLQFLQDAGSTIKNSYVLFDEEEALDDHVFKRWKEWNVSDGISSTPLEYVFPRDDNRWPPLPREPNIHDFYTRRDLPTEIFLQSVRKDVPRRTIDDNLSAVKNTYYKCAGAMEQLLDKLTPGNEEVKLEIRSLLTKEFGKGVSAKQYYAHLDQLLRVKSRYHVEKENKDHGSKIYEVLRTYGTIPLRKGWEKTHTILSEFHQVYLPDLFNLFRYVHGLSQDSKIEFVNCSIDGVDPTGK